MGQGSDDDIEVVSLDSSTATGGHSDDGASRNKSRDRKWLLVVVGMVAAWLGVSMLGRLAAPDEVAQIPRATPTPVPSATPLPAPTPSEAAIVAGSATELPQAQVSTVGLGQSVQVQRMARQLERRSSRVHVAYRSADEIVVVDLAAALASRIAPSLVDTVEGATHLDDRLRDRVGPGTRELQPTDQLLRSAGETFAIDADSLDVRRVSTDASLIVADTRMSEMFWVPGRDLQGQAAEVLALLDDASWWFRAPHATQLVAFDGFGLVAVGKGPNGGTWWAGETEFVEMSPHRLLDANGTSLLEEQCDDAGCTLNVRSIESRATWTVPAGFVDLGDRVELSPDGSALLRYDPHGFAEVYDSSDDSVSWVTGASMRHGAWDPSSSYIVWIDLLGTPELRVMFLDQRDWLSIDLATVGLPRPIGTELVVFEPSS